jgi:putative selenate reductase
MNFEQRETVFGVITPYKTGSETPLEIFGRKLETPIGALLPVLIHNWRKISLPSYFAVVVVSFEFKTVQKLDGDDLPCRNLVIKIR